MRPLQAGLSPGAGRSLWVGTRSHPAEGAVQGKDAMGWSPLHADLAGSWSQAEAAGRHLGDARLQAQGLALSQTLGQDLVSLPSDSLGQGLGILLGSSFPSPRSGGPGGGPQDSRENCQVTRRGRATQSPGRSVSPGGRADSRAPGRLAVAARPCRSPGPSGPSAPARHPARAALGAEAG